MGSLEGPASLELSRVQVTAPLHSPQSLLWSFSDCQEMGVLELEEHLPTFLSPPTPHCIYTHTHACTRTHAHARTAAPSLGVDVLSPLGPHSTLGGHRNACLGPMKDYFRPSTWSALHRCTFLLQGPPAPVQPLYARLSCAWDCRHAPNRLSASRSSRLPELVTDQYQQAPPYLWRVRGWGPPPLPEGLGTAA